MNNQELIKQISNTAEAARNSGQSITVDNMLPTVEVYRGEDDVFFFQESEASGLLEQACQLLERLTEDDVEVEIGEEDVILFQAQGW